MHLSGSINSEKDGKWGFCVGGNEVEIKVWENGVKRDTRARKTETIVWNELDVHFCLFV